MARRHRSGFTLIDLAALIGAGAFALGFAAATAQPSFGKKKLDATPPSGQPAAPATAQPGSLTESLARARASARQLKDSTQIRGILQSMVVWAGSNDGKLPLPSEHDKLDQTVSLNGRAKDTTANILSILIYNGFIAPELCINPAEANPNIKVDERYEYSSPKGAMKPEDALWDPGFKADFTKEQIANNSYAHLQPSDGRLLNWTDSFDTLQALAGNRSPELLSVERSGDETAGWTYTAKAARPDSLTLRIHGAKDTWEGNIGFADGHVAFLTQLAPTGKVEDKKWLAYTTRDDKQFLDCYFVDEEDDRNGSNGFLGIFTTAGKTPKDYRGIWD